ncbi:MAG: hypothetical protein LBE56_01650 [Tannerella sp.]|nr:hypothetical protein [Tannerella sp.]
MRNEDALTGGIRTLAAKFSPYNLTAKDLPEYGGVPTTAQVAVRGGEPVEYPTQAGALWYWAVDAANAANYLRVAYHPSMPSDYSAWSTGWLNTTIDPAYDTWQEVIQSPNNSETCPPGYRRPRDGAIDVVVPTPAINNSEIRQSLWLNPPVARANNTDNSVWGYYADGYFDRLEIENAAPAGSASYPDNVKLTAVRPTTKDVGYMGRLVYNPNNFASLFFPAVGERLVSGNPGIPGGLGNPGNGGYYWTATIEDLQDGHAAWGIQLIAGAYTMPSTFAMVYHNTHGNAISIRCVKTDEPEFLLSRESWVDDPLTLGTTYHTPANKVMGFGKTGSPREGQPNEYYTFNAYGKEGDFDGSNTGTPIDYLVITDRIYMNNVESGASGFLWVKDSTPKDTLYFQQSNPANPMIGDGIVIDETNGNGIYSIFYNSSTGAKVHTIEVANYRDGLDAAHPLLVENRTDLEAIDDDDIDGFQTYPGNSKHYEIIQDLNLGIDPWNPLSGLTSVSASGNYGFQGTFYGNFYAIDGMTITQTEADNSGFGSSYDCGLFAMINGARIQALGVTNVDINYVNLNPDSEPGTGAGAIVGSVNYNDKFLGGQILDCYSSGTITVEGNSGLYSGVGGIIGYAAAEESETFHISRCYSHADVFSDGAAGGIVGTLEKGEISQCYSTGNISDVTPVPDGDAFTGGVVGAVKGISIVNACYSTGTVHGYTAVGGIVGEVDENSGAVVTITNCFSTADVSGNDEVGGIVGRLIPGSTVSKSVALNRTLTSDTSFAGNTVDPAVVGSANGGSVNNNDNHAYDGIVGSVTAPGDWNFNGDWDFITATTLSSYTGTLGWLGANWRMKGSGEGVPANLPILNNVTIAPQPPFLQPGPNPQDDIIDDTATDFAAYVGAFWKANQTGERLIRIVRNGSTYDGEWTAQVIVGNSWIMLDKQLPTDPGIGWMPGGTNNPVNGNDSGFETSYQLPPNSPDFITGTLNASNPAIYFRIGLESTLPGGTSASPPRYGVVLLRYKNTTLSRRIWIRQGEAADYVMRPTDGSRPNAKQFMTYNITADSSRLLTFLGGTDVTEHPQLPANGGTPVDYPSQGGAHFQWKGDQYARIAYRPDNPTSYIQFTNWSQETTILFPQGQQENCPNGYHRPTDGILSAQVPIGSGSPPSSEMRQSLYLNIPNDNSANDDNSAWGYYADGFFDRRTIVNSSVGNPSTTVAPVTTKVAFVGRLFYNPTTNASLFFPAAGERDGNTGTSGNGELIGTGGGGLYWSATSATDVTPQTARYLYITNTHSTQTATVKASALSGRCVKN